MDTEDGQLFVRKLSTFIRTHEKALANALQIRSQSSLQGQPSQSIRDTPSRQEINNQNHGSQISTSSALVAALSLGTVKLVSPSLDTAKLTLTPHHLYFLLVQIEEIGIPIGPMNVRLENLHAEASPANYVSFLSQAQRSSTRSRSDHDSIRSVSSVRSMIAGMSNVWSGLGLTSSSNSAAKSEKTKAQYLADLKYLYSAFTKVPCLRLSPDHKVRLIGGYEEFPFDTAVPLLAFKNVSALEILDLDYRQFYGWDKLAEQLRTLTLKRANLEDPSELLTCIVLDDMDRRRRRSSKAQSSPGLAWPSSPWRASSTPNSPSLEGKLGQSSSPKTSLAFQREGGASAAFHNSRTKSESPSRPNTSKSHGRPRHSHTYRSQVKRSNSESSYSSSHSSVLGRSGSSSNMLNMGVVPGTKWRFLRHLNLSDNGLVSLSDSGFTPIANTLHSLDLSCNLFRTIPDCLTDLKALQALNLSSCMIEALHSLNKNPLPTISALNLRANRLISISGIERLSSVERLDLRDNGIQDPTELARLTGIATIREIWVLRNPFVKTHSHYRVTIFNLFRQTPGYLEDIHIDASGPGRGERKQLKDRVTEIERGPVVETLSELSEPTCPLPDTPSATFNKVVEDFEPRIDILERPETQTTQSEAEFGLSRRKKNPRRRVVDLAKDDSTAQIDPIPAQASQVCPTPQILEQACADEEGKLQLPPPEQEAVSSHIEQAGPTLMPPTSTGGSVLEVSNRGRMLAAEIQCLNTNGDAYRQKVQALKNEVGSNWLTVLGKGEFGSKDLPPTFFGSPVLGSEAPAFRSPGIVTGDV